MEIDRFQEVERFFINESALQKGLNWSQTGLSETLRPDLQEFERVECWINLNLIVKSRRVTQRRLQMV